MPNVLIYTLGCKLNSLESESFQEAAGSGQGTEKQPSIIIVNTCTVTSKADQKARRVIRKALRDYPGATVIVTGCYAELEKENIEKLLLTENTEESNQRFANQRFASARRLFVFKREEVLDFLRASNKTPLPASRSPLPINDRFQFFPEKFSKHTRAFLKIQDGCDNHCAYCRIRLARGKSVSLPAEQVLERLKILEQNHAEAVITGVNICQYRDQGSGIGDRGNFFELLKYLLVNTDKIAIRLSSLDPKFIVDNCSFFIPYSSFLISNRIRPHFHLSIQSCSDKILQKMGRPYNAQIIESAVKLLREAKGDPFIACDIIAGFPGETEEDFAQTFALLKKLDFAWIHAFPYSKRPGTPAAEYKDTVIESEKTRRVQELAELAWRGRREYAKRWLGKEADVIVQGTGFGDRGSGIGLSENYLKTLVRYNGEAFAAGAVVKCRFTEQNLSNSEDFDVIAEIII